MTEAPQCEINEVSKLPVLTRTDVPSAEELEQGARVAFEWLASTFTAASRVVAETGVVGMSFSDDKYKHMIDARLATILDAQVRRRVSVRDPHFG